MTVEFKTVESIERARELLGEICRGESILEYELTGMSSLADGKVEVVRRLPDGHRCDFEVVPWWGPTYGIDEDLAAEELVGHPARIIHRGDTR